MVRDFTRCSVRMVVVLFSVAAVTSMGAAQPRIQVFPGLDIHFGQVYTDNAYSQNLMIVNSGKDTLRLGDIEADCSCAVGDLKSKVIPPADSESIKVMFNSHAHEGIVKQALQMKTNDPKVPLVRISIYATVDRLYRILPEEVKFGEILPGATKKAKVKIFSASDDTLRIVSIGNKDRSISIRPKNRLIPPDGQTELTVVASSKVPGAHFGGVVITFNDQRQRLGGFKWFFTVGGTVGGKGKQGVKR